MALIDDVKVRLRVASTAYDSDIGDLILEAKADLERAGIVKSTIVDTDPSISRAVVCYCRAYFDLASPDMERWERVYTSQRDSLSLDGDYNGLVVDS